MPIRKLYLFGFLFIAALLSFSIYLQFYDGVTPCPLCTLQRITFCLLGVLFLFGLLFSSYFWVRLIINVLALLTSFLGITLAGRQIWLQNYPSGGTECGVSLNYMLNVLPLNEVFQKILAGSAECTQRGWEFLHLNMAEWAFLCFLLFLVLTAYLFLKTKSIEGQ